jgi:hypothetical protein
MLELGYVIPDQPGCADSELFDVVPGQDRRRVQVWVGVGAAVDRQYADQPTCMFHNDRHRQDFAVFVNRLSELLSAKTAMLFAGQ